MATPEKGRISRITRIGGYSLGTKLGEGSFAIVREARHMATDEPVRALAASGSGAGRKARRVGGRQGRPGSTVGCYLPC